jgi:membrane-associated phospholipid phosphatase
MNSIARRTEALVDPYLALATACTLATVLASLAACIATGLSIEGMALPFFGCAAMQAAAIYYQRRQVPNFVLCLRGLILLVMFSIGCCALMYAAASLGHPFVYRQLAWSDAALGLSANAFGRWTDSRPLISTILSVAYFSMLPQTIVVIAFLGLRDEAERLYEFLANFMLCAIVAVAVFYFAPAIGSCANGTIPDHYAPVVEHLLSLRDGSRTIVDRQTQGLITFPSFHAIWAVLLTWAFRGRRLFVPILMLNALVLVSTIPIGMHYFVDVFAGVALCAVVIPASAYLAEFLRGRMRVAELGDIACDELRPSSWLPWISANL